jgi:hypothetical protein
MNINVTQDDIARIKFETKDAKKHKLKHHKMKINRLPNPITQK